jgi:hypothetical protein
MTIFVLHSRHDKEIKTKITIITIKKINKF